MSLAKRAIEEFGACQKQAELEQLIAHLADTPLGLVLEIGVQDGGTLWLWSQLARDDAGLISIDLEAHDGHGREQQWAIQLRADSHSPATFARVQKLLAGRPLDLLFIDGDHSYEGVRQDFETYSPLVRSGGVIALHDVVAHEHPALSEVERFWSELLPGHPEALAFVDESCQDTWRGKVPVRSCGIGVIRQH